MTALRHDLNLGSRLKAGVAGNPVLWFSGAAVVGLLISQIPPSRRKVVVKGPALHNDQAAKAGKAAFALTALKFALDYAKPAIVSWIKKKILERPGSRSSAAK